MGSYTYFKDEDLSVMNWEGLVEFFKVWDKYVKKNENVGDYFSSKKMLDFKEKKISFESWNDIKLISYWYSSQLLFLELVSEFIEGDVEFEFENVDETGDFHFEDGKCKITTGVMDYTEWKPTDNFRVDEIKELKENKEINKLLILKGLK